jgi:glycosyltransferase involved in cell wall biosynthesis
VQYVQPLAERGIDLEVRPFLDARLFATLYRRDQLPRTALGLALAALKRPRDAWRARNADVVMVQREAMMFGPPVIEWLTMYLGKRPLLLDLDDATYTAYRSPTFGRLASVIKCFGKTDQLIDWAQVVTCGNGAIAKHAADRGALTRVIPTVVDTDRFQPAAEAPTRSIPVLGWVGSHSTYPYLQSIFPALQEVGRRTPFHLRVIGSGRPPVEIPGLSIEFLDWQMDREIEDFQSFDIGLYPVIADEWSAGKSGFKSIQYMAVGLPFVATPVGACAEIGVPGITHFTAETHDGWVDTLTRLLTEESLRRRMGAAGREHALSNYTVPAQADKLAEALRMCVLPRSSQQPGKPPGAGQPKTSSIDDVSTSSEIDPELVSVRV